MAEDKKSKKGIGARWRRFALNSRRIFRIAHKPTRKEYWLMMKICIVGIVILGVLGYIIHQVALLLSPLGSSTTSSSTSS